jgi:hypothetical protein
LIRTVEQTEAAALCWTSQPLAPSPSQSEKPLLQLAMAQVPVPHVAVALAREHVTPHWPQLLVVLMAVSQPLAPSPSQLAKFGAQANNKRNNPAS